MQTLTKARLDAWKCPYCDEDDHPLAIQQECCGGAAVHVSYKRTSRLVMKCAECKQEVFHIVMQSQHIDNMLGEENGNSFQIMKKIGVEVVIIKKRSRTFLVRHPDGFEDLVTDIPPDLYKQKNGGDTLIGLQYANDEERAVAAAELKKGIFPEIIQPTKN